MLEWLMRLIKPLCKCGKLLTDGGLNQISSYKNWCNFLVQKNSYKAAPNEYKMFCPLSQKKNPEICREIKVNRQGNVLVFIVFCL